MFEILLFSVTLAAEPVDAAELLRRADAPRQTLLHSVLRVRARIEQDEGPSRTGEFDLYLGNEDQQLIVFRDPRNQGRKFLAHGDQAWLIVPGSKHPIAITANQRMLGASSFADLARVRLAHDYSARLQPARQPCGLSALPCHVLDITARTRTAPYAAGTLWIDANGLLQKAVYRLASGKPSKEVVYRYREIDGSHQPTGLTLDDLLQVQSTAKTTLEYLSIQPDTHPDSWFTTEAQMKQ